MRSNNKSCFSIVNERRNLGSTFKDKWIICATISARVSVVAKVIDGVNVTERIQTKTRPYFAYCL